MKDKNRNGIIINSIICCAYLLLTIFYYHIDRYTSKVICLLLTLLIPITFIAIIACFIKGMIVVYRNRKNLTARSFMPFAICVITLAYTLFSPYQLSSENFNNKSKIVLRACYEGTQNQSTLVFREDKTFELHATGVFFSSFWFSGIYEQSADTLFLHYLTEKPKHLGDTLLIKDDYLFTIHNQQIDASQYFRSFYLGYCKGLN